MNIQPTQLVNTHLEFYVFVLYGFNSMQIN